MCCIQKPVEDDDDYYDYVIPSFDEESLYDQVKMGAGYLSRSSVK